MAAPTDLDNIVPFPGAGSGERDDGDEDAESRAARTWLRDAYARARGGGGTPSIALRAVWMCVEGGLAPEGILLLGLGPEDVRRMAVADGWERAYTSTSKSPRLLASRAVDLASQVEDLLRQEGVARGLLDSATDVIESAPPPNWSGDWPSPAAISNWKDCRNDWNRLRKEVAGLGERLTRLDNEANRSGYWEQVYLERVESLRTEYGGGPQYDLLVESLADIDTRVKQLRSSGRDVEPEEYRQLAELRLKYIAQIQKHTESLKSESVQPVQNAIKKLFEAVEREIKPTDPRAWELLARTVAKVVQENGFGMEDSVA
jgi:hypothetical protein